jgi:hypothetical protein
MERTVGCCVLRVGEIAIESVIGRVGRFVSMGVAESAEWVALFGSVERE